MSDVKTFTATENVSLAGQQYVYKYVGSGMCGEVVFDDKKANWLILEGPNKGMSGSDSYFAQTVAPGVFFIMWHEPQNNITVVLTINENTEHVFATVVSAEEVEFDCAKFCERP